MPFNTVHIDLIKEILSACWNKLTASNLVFGEFFVALVSDFSTLRLVLKHHATFSTNHWQKRSHFFPRVSRASHRQPALCLRFMFLCRDCPKWLSWLRATQEPLPYCYLAPLQRPFKWKMSLKCMKYKMNFYFVNPLRNGK